ncbi:MAG TPA: hypothetical protein VND93_10985 [Myxococcales bacterium]|nr:hypothetical protein [Myxococcales bacterium]
MRRLLPHRPPLLLVDAVTGYSAEPAALRAVKLISSAEPVFAGHFPDLWIWPGVYTIEGLAQACALLGALGRAEKVLGAGLAAALAALDAWAPGAPGAPPPEALAGIGGKSGLLAAVDVKLLRPVFAGQRLEYLAARTHEVGPMQRFSVEASVEGHRVAQGELTVAGPVDEGVPS